MRDFLFWAILLGTSLFANSEIKNSSYLEEKSSGHYEWHLNLPQIEDITFTSTGVEYPGWNMTIDEDGYTLPIQSKLIYTSAGPPQIELHIGELQTVNKTVQPSLVVDQAKGMEYSSILKNNQNSDMVSTKLIREDDGLQLWAINVQGVQVDMETGQWSLPKRISLSIKSDLMSATFTSESDLYLNQAHQDHLDRVQSSQAGLGHGKFKLYLLQDGIYRIFYDTLKQTEDFPDEQIPSRSIKIRHKGEQQAIYVYDGGDGLFDSGDYFDFIGKQNYYTGSSQYFDPFSDINVYWLDWGGEAGLRFIDESGALVDAAPVQPRTFWDVVHIEKDTIFDRLGQVDTDLPTITHDHYFWTSINSGRTEEVNFMLDNPFQGSSQNVEISVGLHALTYSETPGEEAEHTLGAYLNDTFIGDGEWTQQEEYTLVSPSSLNLSHNILSPGTNTLAISVPGSTEPGNYDRIVLNWLEIGYEHFLTAHEDALRFRKSFINPSANLEYEINGFSSPYLVIYKEGISKITGYDIRERWESTGPKFSLVFQDSATDATPDYWATSVESLLQPVHVIADTSVSLREQDGDFIVLAVPEFMGGLEAYLDFKRSEDWNPIAVSVVDVYDEFNYGINSPYAIKEFLQYANNNWPSKPEYVIMLGDAIADPLIAKRDVHIENIPTFYMQTYAWGAAEADFWYSLINGDDYIPDLKIGRIPCSTSEMLEISLNKLIRYGNGDNYGAWQNEVITIAGFDAAFKSQSELLLKNNVPKAFMPSRIFIDRDSEGQIFWGDTDSLVAQWNSGKLLINFLGHGGGAVWADRSLFIRDDIDYLEADAPPAFVTSMTCFTSSFAQVRGLGEVVLTESPSGAVGWFGSSGVGWVINDYFMIIPLLHRLLEERKPVGELINIARIEYYLANGGWPQATSMLFQYNYLGDPTTRLALPEKGDILKSEKTIYAQTDLLDLSYIGDEQGNIKILPINAKGLPWWSDANIYETSETNRFLFAQEDSSASGESRTIYTLDRGKNLSAIQGYTPYGISADWMEHQPPTAGELEVSSFIPLQVQYHSQFYTADSIIVDFSGGNQGTYDLIEADGWWSLPDSIQLSSGTNNTYYQFSAFQQDSLLLTSDLFRLYLPAAISLTINKIEEGHLAKRCGLFIDYSLLGLDEGIAYLEHSDSSSSFEQNISKNVPIEEGNNRIFIPSFFGLDSVTINTSLILEEDMDRLDNTIESTFTPSYYQVLPDLGISFDGLGSDTISMWSNGYLNASMTDTGWIQISPNEYEVESLTGLSLLNDSTIYHAKISSREMTIMIQADQQLFLKDDRLNAWQILDETENGYALSGPGFIAMGEKQDFTGPDVTAIMAGQLFFDGDYILGSSHLNLLAGDENGFSWSKKHVEVLINDVPVSIQYGDTSESARIISIAAALDLSIGEHQMAYRVSDALGNWSEQVVLTGVVAGDAEIIDYGNFPNPFEGETLIIYELTQPLDDVVIEIYTIAGYKLHTIDIFNARVGIPLGAIGYHEVPWNGRDRNEDFVANGVYFYRIKGELDGETLVGSVGKMVKNR